MRRLFFSVLVPPHPSRWCLTALMVLGFLSWTPLQGATVRPSADTTPQNESEGETHFKGSGRDSKVQTDAGVNQSGDGNTNAEISLHLDNILNDVAQELTNLGDNGMKMNGESIREAYYLASRDAFVRIGKEAKISAGASLDGSETPPLYTGNTPFAGIARAPLDRAAYISPPKRISFVTKGKNKLQGLQDALDRAKSKLKKIFPCTEFDWIADFSDKFNVEALKDYVKDLGEGVASAAPMALLQAFSPNLAEIVKHFKVLVSFDLSANKMDCGQMQDILTPSFGKMMRGPGYATCMSQYSDGGGVTEANKQCGNAHSTFNGIDNLGEILNPTTYLPSNLQGNTPLVEEVNPFNYIGSTVKNWLSGKQTEGNSAADAKNRELPSDHPDSNKDPNEQKKIDNSITASAKKGISTDAAEIFKQTLGKFTFSSNGGMTFGKNSPGHWKTLSKAHSFKVSMQAMETLVDYGAVIEDLLRRDTKTITQTDQDRVARYRKSLSIYFRYAFKQPWVEHLESPSEEDKATYFNLETIDKIAHAMYVRQFMKPAPGGVPSAEIMQFIKDVPASQALHYLIESEIAMYFYLDVWKQNIDEIKNRFKSKLNGGQNQSGDQKKEAEKRFTKTMEKSEENLEKGMKELIKKLPRFVRAMNAYPMPLYGTNRPSDYTPSAYVGVTDNAAVPVR